MTTLIEEITEQSLGISQTVCHLYHQYGNAPFSHCGVPRSEQEPHRVDGSWTDLICAVCGLPRCSACASIHLNNL